MIVYQGGYCEIKLPEIRIGKYAKDFVQRVFCTELKLQAERWAKRYNTPVE